MLSEFSFIQLCLSVLFYGLAIFFHLDAFLKNEKQKFSLLFIRLAFIVSTIFFGMEALIHGISFPIVNASHILAFFAWSLALVYLLMYRKLRSDSFGVLLAPILFLLSLISVFTFGARPFGLEATPYFVLHIVSAFFAYASLTISFSATVLYLIQHKQLKEKKTGNFYHKLPSLEDSEILTYRPMLWGVLLLFAAILTGFLWSQSQFGEIFFSDPKTVMTLITAIAYTVVLFLHSKSMMNKSKVAWVGVFVFILMVFGFWSDSFFAGQHNFIG